MVRYDFDKILGMSNLQLWVKVFLASLLLEFTFERLLPRFLDGALLTLGRVTVNFGVLIQFLLLASLAYVLWEKGETIFLKVVSAMVIFAAIFAVPMYYFTSTGARSPPSLSILFEGAALSIIYLAILHRIFMERLSKPSQRLPLLSFLILLLLGFLFAYYYEISVLLLSHYLIILPLNFTLLQIAHILLLVNPFVVFIYSLAVPCEKLNLNVRVLLKILLIPTALFAPLLGAMVVMPRVIQYIVFLFVEILGLTIPRALILTYVIGLWFYLIGVLTLREKGNALGKYYLKQESTALLTILLGGFIFGFVYYHFIRVIGALLLTLKSITIGVESED